ncbi:glycosyltransferase [Sediminicoccus sp. KRV36]|uniref:glycosyltransferase n=1 Tax=Sediminicoccus sp. KRV36 TaxID=3133721 RepID=UPI00200DCCFF|nr:glycosyltransferase [Sediminicoccus rosea]UPY36952.1 glycosyltransferase [Sediminicoccus rosea]
MSGTGIPVVNATIYQDNPYHGLLHAGLAGRYDAIRGTVEDAFSLLPEGTALLHLHWEEHLLRGIPSAAEVLLTVRHLAARLAAFRAAGGRILWTLHNAAPHEALDADAFLELRRAIAATAHRILLHSTEALTLLEAQVGPVAQKAFLLPHPSYLGVYEPEPGSAAPATGAGLLCFGKLRGYKRLDRVVERLPEAFLSGLGARITIAGESQPGDAALDALRAAQAGRATLDWDIRRIPEAETGGLFRAARAVVLDYDRPLSSGVALLALTFGRPLLAPRLPGLLEILPAEAHGLLFTPGSAEDMRRAARDVLTMPEAAHGALAAACLERARHYRPARISPILGAVYDAVRLEG